MRDGCLKEGFIKRSRGKRLFFCHYVKTNCPGESDQHIAAKTKFAQLARLHSSQVAVEEGEGNRRIDVAFTSTAGRRWAVEVQRSGQSAEVTRNRTANLQRLGFAVVWVFFSERRLRELKDGPDVLHVAADDEADNVLHRSPQDSGPSVMRRLTTETLIAGLATGRASWLPVAAFNHRIEGQAEIRSFTCTCGVVSQFPYACPPCSHVAQCGAHVGIAGDCPEFDWWAYFRRNPSLAGAGPPCKIIISRKGRWRKCPACDKGWINDRRHPDDGEPERTSTWMQLEVVLQSYFEPGDYGHWCGLDGIRCRQPEPRRHVGGFASAGQQRLF